MIKTLIVLFCFLAPLFPDKPKVKFREIRNYYVENNKKTLSVILKEEYNKKGDLIFTSISRPSKNRLTEVYYVYNYDEQGRKAGVKEFALASKDTLWVVNRTFEYFNNHIIERSFNRKGKLQSRKESFYADSTVTYADSLVATISFSLVPIESVATETMQSMKYYYDASNRLERVLKIENIPNYCSETVYEYVGSSTEVRKQYDCRRKLEVLKTTISRPRQMLELTEVYSESDTLRSGTKTILDADGYKKKSFNYPDSTQGFYTEYTYRFF